MKKRAMLIAVTTLFAGLVVAGCSGGSGSPTDPLPNPGPVPAPQPSALCEETKGEASNGTLWGCMQSASVPPGSFESPALVTSGRMEFVVLLKAPQGQQIFCRFNFMNESDKLFAGGGGCPGGHTGTGEVIILSGQADVPQADHLKLEIDFYDPVTSQIFATTNEKGWWMR